jgi:serine/threonine protein kinase
MYSRDDLFRIKRSCERAVFHENSLRPGTRLKRGIYEIVHLEEVCTDYLKYKGLDLNSGDFVIIKEYYPKEAIGFNDVIYFERDLETDILKVVNPSKTTLRDADALMDAFVYQKRYKEKMVIRAPLTRIVDDFKDLGTTYVVNTYNPWPSLEMMLLSDIEINGETIDQWIRDLIGEIHPFHKRGIVHKNINPRTLFVTQRGLFLDGIGSCKAFTDVKIFDGDEFESRYYAPEINMSLEEIGTWSDIYAVGKVIVDMLTRMDVNINYLDALKSITDTDQGLRYDRVIKESIAFDVDQRLTDIQSFKLFLYPDEKELRNYKPPKQLIIAMVALAIFSSSLVLWRSIPGESNESTVLDCVIIDAEETPLSIIKPVNFLKTNQEELSSFSDEIKWSKVEDCQMVGYKILSDDQVVYEEDLRPGQVSIDLSQIGLSQGFYQLILSYAVKEDILSESLMFRIIE